MKKNIPSQDSSCALSPVDGRYFLKLHDLSQYFSEKALFKNRLFIEIKYLIFLSEEKIIRKISRREKKFLEQIFAKFNNQDFLKIKKIEEIINHDVKAVEYFLQEKLEKTSLEDLITFIHIGLTSEDINNLSYGLILKKFKDQKLIVDFENLVNKIKILSGQFKNQVILGRTHSQPAVSTTLGKEFFNYYHRLKKQLEQLKDFQFEGKLNGAVGNFNALKLAFPQKDWLKFSERFILSLGLQPNLFTTQILFYDNWLEFFQIVYLVNGILIDFSINVWNYLLLDILTLQKKEKEVGSSTMPQKVNPINFEQAEGVLGLANSMLNFFIQKLTHSRLQRDLSDSIVRRFFGEALALTILGWQSFAAGLEKINPNEKAISQELENHYEVLAEAIQVVLRLKKDKKGYEKVKKLVRGKNLQKSDYLKIIKSLGLEDNKNLIDLTPKKYIGEVNNLVKL